MFTTTHPSSLPRRPESWVGVEGRRIFARALRSFYQLEGGVSEVSVSRVLTEWFWIASILDESQDVMQSSSSTIKMENSSAASGTYYCNAYPPGIVSAGAGTGADRSSTSSMAVSSGYSKCNK